MPHWLAVLHVVHLAISSWLSFKSEVVFLSLPLLLMQHPQSLWEAPAAAYCC